MQRNIKLYIYNRYTQLLHALVSYFIKIKIKITKQTKKKSKTTIYNIHALFIRV